MKKCFRCKAEKPLEAFTRNRRKKDGLQHWCRSCTAEWHKDNYSAEAARRYRNDPGRARALALRRHGMTVEQYEKMVADQGGCCAICGTDDPGKPSWSVDHDHDCCSGPRSCGLCVRALLCTRCNMGLGFFGDSPARLIAAAAYLGARNG